MKKASVKNGIDRLNEIMPELSGAKIGLITNQTGVDRSGKSSADLLFERGLLACLFAPEHGIRGTVTAGAHVGDCTDEATGVPIYSLYGASVQIPEDVLSGLDAVAFDIQDIGARFYTYTSTLAFAMQDCAKAGKKMIIFDRINPVGALHPEGTVLDMKFSSFVGRFPTATRHNLTVGEYATFINETQAIGCELLVVEVSGWERNMIFEDTDLKWIAPSPNIKTANACFYYLGTCLAEGTNLSEGRGSDSPFELIGAPWLNAEAVAEKMNALGLSGVGFCAERFVPSTSKHAGVSCNGIRLLMTDPRIFAPFETALRLFEHIRQTHREFNFLPPHTKGAPCFVDLLLGSDKWRKPDFDIDAFLNEQNEKLRTYENAIKDYYLY